jgi:hypothetical protein
MAGGYCWLPRTADHHAQGLLSSFSLCHKAAPTGPPSFFPSLPRAIEELEKPPAILLSTAPKLELLPPFSTAYMSASPAPTTGDPSSYPVPI